MATEQQHIDGLLQRYLELLDEYMRLRADMGRLQADVYQGIARANFSAERGMRYGQDHYDERMRATRLLSISREDDASAPVFDMTCDAAAAAAATDLAGGGEPGRGHDADAADGEAVGEREREPTATATTQSPKPAASSDPLRWFGLLAPAGLRSAQSRSVDVVRRVVPRLASVHAEMLSVEIEVRRARKRRAKALARHEQGDAGRAGPRPASQEAVGTG